MPKSGSTMNQRSQNFNCVLQPHHIAYLMNVGRPHALRQFQDTDFEENGTQAIDSYGNPIPFKVLKAHADAKVCALAREFCGRRINKGGEDIIVDYVGYNTEQASNLHNHLVIRVNKRIYGKQMVKALEFFAPNIHIDITDNTWTSTAYLLKGECDWKNVCKRSDGTVSSSTVNYKTVSELILEQFPDWMNQTSTLMLKDLIVWCHQNLIDDKGIAYGDNCNGGLFGNLHREQFLIVDGDFSDYFDREEHWLMPKTGKNFQVGSEAQSAGNKRSCEHSEGRSNKSSKKEDAMCDQFIEMTTNIIEEVTNGAKHRLRYLVTQLKNLERDMLFKQRMYNVLNKSKIDNLIEKCCQYFIESTNALLPGRGGRHVYSQFNVWPGYEEWSLNEHDMTCFNVQISGLSGHGKTARMTAKLEEMGIDPKDRDQLWRTAGQDISFSGYGHRPGQEGIIFEELDAFRLQKIFKYLLILTEMVPFGVRKSHSSADHPVTASFCMWINTVPILLMYIRYQSEIEKHNKFQAGLDPEQLNRRWQRMEVVYLHGIDKPPHVPDEYLHLGEDGKWRSMIWCEKSFIQRQGTWYLHEDTLAKIIEGGAIDLLTTDQGSGGWDICPETGEVSPGLTPGLAEQAAS